jgi:hypothetical protein
VATAKEVLALVITGDGRGAISEVQKVSGATRTHLGAAEQATQRYAAQLQSTGLAAMAMGATASVGLLAAARGAAQYETDIRRIDNTFGRGAAGVRRFVDDANRIGLARSEAASYTASIGETAVAMGISERAAAALSTQTVDLLSQLALIKGVAPADALERLSSALIGEYDGLQRLVPTISDAAIKERALANTRKASVDDLTAAEKATATFQLTLESANRSVERAGGVQGSAALAVARANAQWRDMKDALGAGAVPMLSQLGNAASTALGAFNTVDRGSGGLLGQLVTAGAVATTVGGGLAFLGGKALQLRADFTAGEGAIGAWRNRMVAADGTATRFGTTVGRLGTALRGLTIAGGILLAGDLVGQLINAIDGQAGQQTDALNRVLATSGANRLAAFEAATRTRNDAYSLGRPIDWALGAAGAGRFANVSVMGGGAVSGAVAQGEFDAVRAQDPAAARELLDMMEASTQALGRNSEHYRANTEFIERNRRSMRLAADAQRDHAGETRDGSAEVERSTFSLRQQAFAYDATATAAQGAKTGAMQYVENLQAGFGVLLGVIDANRQLADAQKRLGEIRTGATPEVLAATRSLADAQRDLNRVLRDDPMFGLQSVSAADQIADARNRLAEANRRLAANPNDPFGLTMKDEAILDLEAASRRRQDDLRNGQRRAEEIEDARRRVADAQRDLSGAQARTGPNSEEYQRASEDVMRANLDVEASLGQLAQFMRDNGIAAVGELNAKLDEWIARGGPVGEAAATMKGQLQPLLVQALQWAAGLGAVNTELDKLREREVVWPTAAETRQREGRAGPENYGGGRGRANRRAATPQEAADMQVGIGAQERFLGRDLNSNGIIGRDAGGAVNAGQMYRVNENRTELIVLPRPGHVVPDLRGLRAGVGAPQSGGGVTFAPNITQVVPEPERAGEAVVEALYQLAFRAGRGLRAGAARPVVRS